MVQRFFISRVLALYGVGARGILRRIGLPATRLSGCQDLTWKFRMLRYLALGSGGFMVPFFLYYVHRDGHLAFMMASFIGRTSAYCGDFLNYLIIRRVATVGCGLEGCSEWGWYAAVKARNVMVYCTRFMDGNGCLGVVSECSGI